MSRQESVPRTPRPVRVVEMASEATLHSLQRRLKVVLGVAAFVDGNADALPKEAELSERQRSYLESPRGLEKAAQWTRSFQRPLSEMQIASEATEMSMDACNAWDEVALNAFFSLKRSIDRNIKRQGYVVQPEPTDTALTVDL